MHKCNGYDASFKLNFVQFAQICCNNQFTAGVVTLTSQPASYACVQI